MLEVEVKYRLDDPAGFAAKLANWTSLGARRDEDHYFNAPDRDFKATGEAFRVRCIGTKNYITYKGPKTDKETKTRFEMELQLLDGAAAAEDLRQFLQRLGYLPVGVVRKTRQVFETVRSQFNVQATIDAVDNVGTFAELEIVAAEPDFEPAKAVVLQIAAELGLQHQERRSYLSLMLDQATPRPATVVVRRLDELRNALTGGRRRIGLVPTMGALHAGHTALIDRARADCDVVVATIFVNPAQFGPNEDFAKYPRTFDADMAVCEQHGVDYIFAPDSSDIYPSNFSTYLDVGNLGTVFEGAVRPGHFRGVATVVLKLLNMVRPSVAYFGQKDAQQVAVIRQLVRDLNVPTRLEIVPTVREADGLALSSRNRYLDSNQRAQAPTLYRALTAARAAWSAGERDPENLARVMSATMQTAPDAKLDYAAVVDPDTFGAPTVGRGLAILAARFGTTRLIDNLLMD